MGAIRTGIYESVLYPLYQYSYGAGVIGAFRHLEKTQWLSPAELYDYKFNKLKKLVNHAYAHVPYYRDVMTKNGIVPADINTLDDIRLFPVLTKELIRNNYDRLISDDNRNRKLYPASTGGSTGEPLRFVRDGNAVVWTEAALMRGKCWAGFRTGDRAVNFMTVGKSPWPGRIRERVINNFTFSAFEKQRELVGYARKIRKIGPKSVTSYASNLYRVARIFHDNGIRDLEVPVIFSTGEMLYDHQREFIERVFRGKVFDYYGCNEIGSLAYECEYHERHITDEHVLIEVAGSHGASVLDSLGEFIITDLDNFAMPFIRYTNGDAGIITQERCRCGRGLTLMRSLEGRVQEFLRTVDGNYVPSVVFPGRFRNLKGLDQYQIIQEDIREIILNVVKNRSFTQEELDEMVSVIKELLGAEVKVVVREKDHIELTARGKNRLVISKVKKGLF